MDKFWLAIPLWVFGSLGVFLFFYIATLATNGIMHSLTESTYKVFGIIATMVIGVALNCLWALVGAFKPELGFVWWYGVIGLGLAVVAFALAIGAAFYASDPARRGRLIA